MTNPQELVYFGAGTTGLMTGIAAASATAGHITAFRWSSSTYDCYVQRVRATWTTIAGFTAEQEIGMDLVIARAYTVAHSGSGTAKTYGTNDGKLWTPQKAAAGNSLRMSATAELTPGTHTLDAIPLFLVYGVELATGAGVYRGAFTKERNFMRDGNLLRLRNEEGLVLRNLVAMGAGGTARVQFEIDWQVRKL